MKKLTLKQQKFVDNYIQTGEATQSAIDAGYSPKTARAIASENLTKPYISDIIRQNRQKATKEAEINLNWVLLNIKEIAEAGSETNRIKALDMLMKHLGAYTDKLEVLNNISEQQAEQIISQILINLNI